MTRPAMLTWLACLALAGCEKARQDMYDQPRYKPHAASSLFADGSSSRVPPPGIQPYAQGTIAGTSSARAGTGSVARDEEALAARRIPYPLTLALLQRGQERFSIYCQPCHSPTGDGDGLVVRRGFPRPSSFHIERLRKAPDRHFFDAISSGYGLMYSYADRVEPADRWAIVAYIRALQLSQHARAAELPAEERARLPAAQGTDRDRSMPASSATALAAAPGAGR
ncbi:MAG: cytochrome c [Zoogloea sp.]|nr:cytochrome c [Zoogloea sp.]